MEAHSDIAVRQYLADVQWPEGLRVGYRFDKDKVLLMLHEVEFLMLSPEEVVTTAATITKTLTWVNGRGVPAYLRVLK